LPELVRINLEPVIKQVQAVLNEFPQVAGAYLFGSAMELCRPDSDIDLGLILEPEVKPDTQEGDVLASEVAFSLKPVNGHPFDVVLLDPGKPLFVFRVIKEGKLVYCRNRDRVTDLIEYVSRRYADLYPRYRRALEEILNGVAGQ